MLDLDAIRKRDAALGPLESAEVRAPSAMAELDRRALLALVDELHAWQRAMVEKAAAKSLDGYRELGQKAAKAENRAEYWKAEHQAANREIDRLKAELFAVRSQAGRIRRGFDRYQWLRNTYTVTLLDEQVELRLPFGFKARSVNDIDAVIDEAAGFNPMTPVDEPVCAECFDSGCCECHSCNSPGCSICTEPNTKSQELSDGR